MIATAAVLLLLLKLSLQASVATDSLTITQSGSGITSEPCGENEVMLECGSSCEPTCMSKSPQCEDECSVDVCGCIEGFIRSEIGGPCILASACPSEATLPQGASCDAVVCQGETHCEIVDLPCVDDHCLQEAVCVDD
ncbi:hypothetical protein RB195_012788 [Necator americanus]|uniref:TIL domain-containing protein n=1 Tax=Necator americanus TaxID=51031 RepID=A0ABR1DT33_NECAM